MPHIDLWVLGVQLVLLAGALAGAGVGYLRFGLRILRTNLSLGWVEQSLIGLYVPLGILYVLASLPLPLFSLATVLGVLAIGWALLIGTELRRGHIASRISGLAQTLRPWGRGWIAAVVIGTSTLGLLAFEVVVMGGVAAPNTFDGSIQVDFVVLLLQHHTDPWTLAPFAPNAGVVYPQGTAVTLASATLLLGWPVVMSPAFLSPLFAALSVPAGYVLGIRLVGNQSKMAFRFGLILAAVFATLSTWPRFLVGGSYDFLFSVPLLFVLVGGALVLSRSPRVQWQKVALYAVGAGVLGSFSLVSLQFLLCFLVVLVIARHSGSLRSFVSGLGRAATVAAVSLAFLSRSIMGWIVWWSYPGHTLTEVGNGPEWTPPVQPSNPIGSLTGLVDPFLFRPVDVWLSPFPLLKAELALLLVAGLIAISTLLMMRHSKNYWAIPRELGETLLFAIFACLLLIGFLVMVPGVLAGKASASVPSNGNELSIILFILYTVITAIPLLWASRALASHGSAERSPTTRPPHLAGSRPRARGSGDPVRLPHSFLTLLILVVPIVSGGVMTVSQAPQYLGDITGPLGNVTPADYSALEWMGTHLPGCSGVLVAPGSAGQFLPVYSSARLVFPVDPIPLNLSYHRVVEDLTAGFVNATTVSDMRSLQLTEVFVSGRSNLHWMPFQTTPLESSSDFVLIYTEGDAYVFEFVPGVIAMGCPAANR